MRLFVLEPSFAREYFWAYVLSSGNLEDILRAPEPVVRGWIGRGRVAPDLLGNDCSLVLASPRLLALVRTLARGELVTYRAELEREGGPVGEYVGLWVTGPRAELDPEASGAEFAVPGDRSSTLMRQQQLAFVPGSIPDQHVFRADFPKKDLLLTEEAAMSIRAAKLRGVRLTRAEDYVI
jgi:hypothetical protein